ncbi:MAG TPA: hypothetical protein VHE55_19085 [Fimbriimonadaceae bacterium]|nr:hypothetical protein [Fimbriimonadaceae bacterium]
MKAMSVLALALAALCAQAQQPKAEDVKSIDSIIAALYDVISGPPGAKHDWDRLRSLFAPGARMIGVETRSGDPKSHEFSVEDYIRLSGPYIEKNGFVEKEVSRKMETFKHIAHVFSSYESRMLATDKKPFASGVNSIQLFNDGKRWWIESVFWED